VSVRRALTALAAAVGAWTCASPTAPPGGPEDELPPTIVSVSPDSGAVRVRPEAITVRFDEIISEVPQGGGSDLRSRILLSPSDGEVRVRWQRDRLRITPQRGWRDNTVYVLTILPGIADLSGNVRDSARVIVFSTGDEIPPGRIDGVVFDWMKAEPASKALVRARPISDTTLVWSAETDSLGRFSMPFMVTGRYQLTALLDQNGNGLRDPRELWDSTTIELRDSVRQDLYAFPNDTLPPTLLTVSAADSGSLRLTFDRPLAPGLAMDAAVTMLDADSQRVSLGRVLTAAVAAREKAVRDSVQRDSTTRARAEADTTAAGREARERAQRDSVERAQAVADSIAADTVPRVPRPVSARPALQTELIVELPQALTPQLRYTVTVTVTGANGLTKTSSRPYSPPRPATRDTVRTAADSAGRVPPPDSTRVPPPDGLGPSPLASLRPLPMALRPRREALR
jgi:hypothetical protein